MAVREIGAKLVLGGEAEFNSAMKSVNSNLKTLKSDMNACTAEFDSNASSSQALAAKQRILDDVAAQHGAKVEALRNRYQHLAETQGEESAAADKAKQALNAATVAQLKAVQAADKNREALKQAQKSENVFVAAVSGVKNALESANNKIEDHDKKVKHAKEMWENFTRPVATANKLLGKTASIAISAASSVGSGILTSLGGITKVATVTTTALAGAGVAALGLMTSYAKEAAESAKAAKEAGDKLTPTQQTWLEFSTQLDTLDAAAASAKAALGSVLLPVLSDMSTVGAEYLQGFASEMEAAAGDTKKQGQIITDYVAKGAQLIKEKLPEYAATGKALLQGLGEGMAENGPEILDIGIDLVMDLLDGLISAAPQVGDAAVTIAGKLLDTLSERGPDMLSGGMDMVVQLITGLAQAAPKIVPQAINLVTTLLTTLLEHAPDLLLAGLQLILGIISGLAEGLGNIKASAGEIIQTVKDAFSEKAGEIKDVGMQVVTGIWNGIASGYDWIIGKLGEWLTDVVQFIKDKLGIHSPSKVLADQVGAWMPRGIWAGFEQEMPAVNRMIANSINTTFDLPGIRTGRTSSGTGSYAVGGKTVNLYFSAKQITQADISMIVDTVNRELGGAIA